jgi:hypothetical protein
MTSQFPRRSSGIRPPAPHHLQQEVERPLEALPAQPWERAGHTPASTAEEQTFTFNANFAHTSRWSTEAVLTIVHLMPTSVGTGPLFSQQDRIP